MRNRFVISISVVVIVIIMVLFINSIIEPDFNITSIDEQSQADDSRNNISHSVDYSEIIHIPVKQAIKPSKHNIPELPAEISSEDKVNNETLHFVILTEEHRPIPNAVVAVWWFLSNLW